MLAYRHGTWDDRFPWGGRQLYVTVAGSEAAPDRALEATAQALVSRFDEVAREVEAFAVALVPEGRVRMDRRENEGFRARICGFAPGEFWFDGVRALDVEHPARALVSFVTGYPDGHVSYVAVFEEGRIVEIVAEV